VKRQQMAKYILGGVIGVGLTFFCASSAVSVENSKYKLTLDRLQTFCDKRNIRFIREIKLEHLAGWRGSATATTDHREGLGERPHRH
jgi:hypothetical protein